MTAIKAASARAATACLVCVSWTSWAQATRTWVSGVGDDANPCSRTAPCQSLAAALSKTAPGGEIDVLDPGGFGPATVTKAITIDGRAASANVLANGTTGIVVDAGPSDTVILRNLSFQGTSTGLNGVAFFSGQSLHVEDCAITGFSGNGIDFEPADGGMLFVKGVVLRSNGNAGVYVRSGNASPASAMVVKSRAVGNAVGFMVGSNGKMSLYRSVASENSDAGLLAVQGNAADPTGAEINAEELVLTENSVGARAEAASGSGSAIIRLSKALVTENTAAPTAVGGVGRIVSFGNNRIVGGSLTACRPGTIALSPTTLPEATAGNAMTVTFTAMGAWGGVTFSQTGALPAGMSFNQGTLSGTPTQSGTFPITVTATDGSNCGASIQYQLVVTGADSDGGSGTPNHAGGCGCGTDGMPVGLSAILLALAMLFRRRARALLPSPPRK